MSFMDNARRLAGQAGLLLGWRPDEFWRATPDELETAFTALRSLHDGGGETAPLDRHTLTTLMEMHPDGR
jgi:uncharacterized phage protein (TIGR02216 family)